MATSASDRRGPSGHDRGTGGTLDYAERTGLEVRNGQREQHTRQIPQSLTAGLPTFAPGPADPRWPDILSERPDLAPALESTFRGVADGIPDWLDRTMSNRTKRLGRLGNAVVPDCAEWIGRQILTFEGLSNAN
jgi:DNA (cytosine-5)-methyltransferase 1